jgi:hypothetical protein
MLVEEGADVEAKGGYYGHALQVACLKGRAKIREMLLSWGLRSILRADTTAMLFKQPALKATRRS